MDGAKESKLAIGAATLSAVNNLAPPTILAQASRLNFSTRLFNLIVTNVPGPQMPLYVLGRELRDLFPVAFLPDHHALAIAIMSYHGGLDYGLLADYDSVGDIAIIAEGIDRALAQLLAAARGVTTAADAPIPDFEVSVGQEPSFAPIVPPGSGRARLGPAADMRAKRSPNRGGGRR